MLNPVRRARAVAAWQHAGRSWQPGAMSERPLEGGHATVLLVADLRRAGDYYRRRLGFTVELHAHDPEQLAWAHRDGFRIQLAQLGRARPRRYQGAAPRDMFDAYFCPTDLGALHAEFTARGATIIQPLAGEPSGVREFRVQDPDGYVIAFGPLTR